MVQVKGPDLRSSLPRIARWTWFVAEIFYPLRILVVLTDYTLPLLGNEMWLCQSIVPDSRVKARHPCPKPERDSKQPHTAKYTLLGSYARLA